MGGGDGVGVVGMTVGVLVLGAVETAGFSGVGVTVLAVFRLQAAHSNSKHKVSEMCFNDTDFLFPYIDQIGRAHV